MNTRNIIIGVVIVIVIYLLYLWFFGDNGRSYLSGMRNAEHSHTIDQSHLPHGANTDYTYSIWLFISNWNYRAGEEKIIFDRGMRPQMSLGANLNNVTITLATYPGHQDKPHRGGYNPPSSCVLENIPLQAWANVIMTLNNRALDLYLDGKLVRTCVLPGVPMHGKGNVVLSPSGGGTYREGFSGENAMGDNIKPMPASLCPKCPANGGGGGGKGGGGGGGFEGFISNFQYFSRAVNPREAYAIYREGPGGSNWLSNLFNKYRLKIAFMKDNKEVNSFEI